MDAARKRHRGNASEAAARGDEDDSAAIPGREARHQVHSSKSAIPFTSTPEEACGDESDYAVLVKRSTALLAKLGQRNVLDNCAAQETSSTQKEATQPMTLPCRFENHKFSLYGVSCSAGSLVLPFATAACIQPTELAHRSTKCTQTESSTTLEARKKLLATELSELYTLLHVFFS
ncbi:A-1 protein [Leishmania donovani]|uniref:A-1 protein, putative n=1 Tax=Leishmania donovani TaxID=5661 RepID=A0A3S7X2A2_LEIDO|nr:A-1 protein, putative [Leishmania donovani]AYU80583.1 A-1 protein, putative [Leishmania donovani]CAJ1990571.1 A-1 protein [Leishmania donovani]CBZ35826.1 A-1 protein, putative [Leishmania donovani]VDZ46426.1 A-1_protein_putative/GeneDB:LmjF.29.0935 [Leishmania donovani]